MRCLALLVIAIPLVSVIAGCPNGWVSYNNQCYQFNNTQLNWFRAKQSCEDQNAQLVVVESKDESVFLKNEIRLLHQDSDPQKVGYWTAGNDLAAEGHYVWGYPAETDIQFTDWFTGEPNNSWNSILPEDCIVMWGHDQHNYQWNDQPCHFLDRYVCEMMSESGPIVG